MIALIQGASVLYGPADWDRYRVQHALYPFGYTNRGGEFFGPDGQPVAFPEIEPTARVDFPECAILPVVTVDLSTPAGKLPTGGRETVILEDRVELRTAFADAPPLDTLKDQLKTSIEAKRDAVIAAGITVTFPDGQAVVQTRDERDIRNANGVAAQGLAMQVNSQTGTLVYRDAANVLHEMTPAQAVAFGQQVAQGIQAVYTASWAKKAEVDALATVEAAQGYDVDTGWPG